jgi:hypothetical protein
MLLNKITFGSCKNYTRHINALSFENAEVLMLKKVKSNISTVIWLVKFSLW